LESDHCIDQDLHITETKRHKYISQESSFMKFKIEFIIALLQADNFL